MYLYYGKKHYNVGWNPCCVKTDEKGNKGVSLPERGLTHLVEPCRRQWEDVTVRGCVVGCIDRGR